MCKYIDELKRYINIDAEQSLNKAVYDGLRNAIINGVIPAGERLNEKAYSQSLNISRTPLRNAIAKLKSEGIVEHIPNYGVVIKMITVQDAEEIYKIRIALEILASLTSMEKMNKPAFTKMIELLDKTDEINNKGEVEEVIRFFSEFNSMIYRYAEMPRLEIIVNKLQGYLVRFRDISLYDDIRRAEALAEHRQIINALMSKDEKLVKKIVETHLGSSKEFVINAIKKGESKIKQGIITDSDHPRS